MNIPPYSLQNFRQDLEQSKISAGHISHGEVALARQQSKLLPSESQVQAMDLLLQEVTQHGSPEARAFYSLNPSLSRVDILSALTPEAQAELKHLSQDKISLEAILALPQPDKQQVRHHLRKARDFYSELAGAQARGFTHEQSKADQLSAFLDVWDRLEPTAS